MPGFGMFFKNEIKAGDKVLDIGCGDKSKTDWIHRIGEVVTVDAWDKVNPDVLMNVGEEKLPFEDNSFDVVLMYDFIEHLTKEEGLFALGEAQRVCKGKIILVTPIIWSDNAQNVNNPKLWCYGNEYDHHKSLWMPEDFDAMDDWWRIMGVKNDNKYYLGAWHNGE